MPVNTIRWAENSVWVLDQRGLPLRADEIRCETLEKLCEAIRTLAVRGAPLLGIAAAYGLALAQHKAPAGSREAHLAGLEEAAAAIRKTRPTAVNLFWALDRMLKVAEGCAEGDDLAATLLAEARTIQAEDEAFCRAIGSHGASLVKDGERILTHCNAGGLATGGYGTAVGVIRAAHGQGKKIHVVVDETRPLLQGARLTTFELQDAGIPYTLITDNMAGALMRQGRVSMVVVGADRIAANGDVANKIGTYTVAVLARAHGLPFYVAAPFSTIDLSLPSGDFIEIEERKPDEVTSFAGTRTAPEGTTVANPAFDVTPARLVTAIITEHGVLYPDYRESLRRAEYPDPFVVRGDRDPLERTSPR
ncbi:MAG: S-methyl-5-thioribose-1-phosphate isomerase [Candidatus Xenobia bacterium]